MVFPEIPEVLIRLRHIDKWVRRTLCWYLWKQWEPVGYRELRKQGLLVGEVWNTSRSAHGPSRLSETSAVAIARYHCPNFNPWDYPTLRHGRIQIIDT